MNEFVETFTEEPMLTIVKRQKIKWFGHVIPRDTVPTVVHTTASRVADALAKR